MTPIGVSNSTPYSEVKVWGEDCTNSTNVRLTGGFFILRPGATSPHAALSHEPCPEDEVLALQAHRSGLGQAQSAAAHPHAALAHVRPTCPSRDLL